MSHIENIFCGRCVWLKLVCVYSPTQLQNLTSSGHLLTISKCTIKWQVDTFMMLRNQHYLVPDAFMPQGTSALPSSPALLPTLPPAPLHCFLSMASTLGLSCERALPPEAQQQLLTERGAWVLPALHSFPWLSNMPPTHSLAFFSQTWRGAQPTSYTGLSWVSDT